MATPTRTSAEKAHDTFELSRAVDLLLERRLLTLEQAVALRADGNARRTTIARELRERGFPDAGRCPEPPHHDPRTESDGDERRGERHRPVAR